MHKRRLFPIFFIATFLIFNGNAQESHLTECGSSAILARSAFAHGYRHGYESGYHLGNIDANMGRSAQVKKIHDENMAYSSKFGSRQSFEQGFRAGQQAGYHDGYAGSEFRVIDSVRSLATNMETPSVAADPSGDFDQGLGSGYHDGFTRGQSSPSLPATLDFLSVDCASLQGSFCEGYRRGFVLGKVDALTLHRENILEASK
jgi:hypothetical protein